MSLMFVRNLSPRLLIGCHITYYPLFGSSVAVDSNRRTYPGYKSSLSKLMSRAILALALIFGSNELSVHSNFHLVCFEPPLLLQQDPKKNLRGKTTHALTTAPFPLPHSSRKQVGLMEI